ncbi:MAG: IPTL-CTERM sorting domain-containing protein, partial [Planctomycetes bacterium]|nr:IPTL-CTERM sorting domain-containing protein [Planctomycetota bacterium]
ADSSIIPIDFAVAEVCQKPAAACCQENGSCAVIPPEECTGIAGVVGTIAGGPASCGGDPDGDEHLDVCDNCPDDFNPDQGDCDGDGEGDACEADEADQDDDGDGVCNGVDNCPLNPDPNQDDTDGDGAGDPCDPCPIDPNDDSDGDGVCDSADICQGHDDNADADGDGVPDGCDQCPDSDDNAPGAGDDDDGDGVVNCNDRCPGVDDTVFAPECKGAIPTTSQWGLIVLTLLLLAGGKIFFGIGAKRVARS